MDIHVHVHVFFPVACDLCILASNHKIVGISTLSRKEHATAQTRELECTKIVLPQVVERGTCTCIYIIIYMYMGVLCCFALFVCLTLCASFFHLICIFVYMYVYVVYFYMCIYNVCIVHVYVPYCNTCIMFPLKQQYMYIFICRIGCEGSGT